MKFVLLLFFAQFCGPPTHNHLPSPHHPSSLSMLLRSSLHRYAPPIIQARLSRMASHLSNGSHADNTQQPGVSLEELPKTSTFTKKLPGDPAFKTPEDSDHAPREALGPRMVRGALYTYVKPEPHDEAELLGVSPRAMRDLGLKEGEEKTQDFKDMVAGNKIFWSKKTGGIYPWAQCYGGEF